MAIYTKLIILLWIIFMMVWIAHAFNQKRNARSGWQRSLSWRVLALITLYIIVSNASAQRFLVRYAEPHAGNPILPLFGVLVCAAGVAFAIWARLNIGRNWGMPMSRKENPELVTSGPYAYVRHPIYSGVIIAMLGSALVIGSAWLVLFVFSFVYFYYNARSEEALMTEIFPAEYPAYKARTKMLIPFVF